MGSTKRKQIQNWENEAQAILQKRLDGLLQTTVNTTSNNTRNATPSKKAKKKTSMENVKLMNQFNASPIVKSVTSSDEK